VKTIPSEAGPYILATAIMAVLFVAALIRVWLLRRVEEKLLKNKDKLEAQVIAQQKDLMQVRSDANAWRSEMQRQFDHFRHMASDQLKVEETRFDNLLTKSRDREHELQATLDLTRQMCAELPAAKARVMQLEGLLGIDGGEGLTHGGAATEPVNGTSAMSILPDLNGSGPETLSETLPEPDPAPRAEVLTENITEVPNYAFEELRQQNTILQQALTAERLRARIREKSSASSSRRKNGRS
jgi:hypothetical protein